MIQFKELGKQCLRIGLSLLVTLLFGISGALAATTGTNSNTNNNDDNQHKSGIWDGGIGTGTDYHPGTGGMAGGAGTGASATNPHATATTGSQLSSTATTGTNANANTYQRLTSKPGTTGSAIGTKKQAEMPGKVQPTRQPSWSDDQTIPANAGQGKFIVKMSHHKKSVHKHYKTTWRKGQKLDKWQKKEVHYMKNHWNNYNTKHYPSFDLGFPKFWNAKSGDCTNWASQCTLHGGKKITKFSKHEKKGLHGRYSKDDTKWYCQVKYKKHNLLGIKWKTKQTRYSRSWTSVDPFWKYWTKTKHKKHFTTKSMKKIMRQARVGDIVQFASGKKWHHTAVISKVTKNSVYYTSHNYNHLFASLYKARNAFPNPKFRLIKMGV